MPAPTPAPTLTISPQSVSLRRGESQPFTATVAVTWSIQEGASGGTIDDTGLYTAPTLDGTYHVVATSKSDPTQAVVASISVAGAGFSPTGALISNRVYHTANLLANGEVLVAGGLADFSTRQTLVDQSEQFDPTLGRFEAGGSFLRYCHSATVLLNGDVLLAGGFTAANSTAPSGGTNSAVIFRTADGSFQPTGSMSIPRCWHKATLLRDGRVLITGGAGPSPSEIYDPSTGTFEQIGPVNASSGSSSTLLADGRVLIVGFTGAEIFDPMTNSFSPTGSPLGSRFWDETATLLPNGKVLIAGGERYYDEVFTGPAELYDPATGQFSATGSMLSARFAHTATLLQDGTVLLTGGFDVNEATLSSSEIYDPSSGVFKPGPNMRQSRAAHTATLLPDGSVLIVGGGTVSAQAEIFK